MSNTVPSYFYPPTWDYPPDGPIRLGNVIASLQSPHMPIYQAPLPADDETIYAEQKQVTHFYESLTGKKFSLLAKFLALIGVDVGLQWDKTDSQTFAFDKVETRQFVPNPEYIANCAAAELVQRYFQKSNYRKPLYIITGVKHVSGCKARATTSRTTDVKFHVEADAGLLSVGVVPISGGPDLGHQKSNRAENSWAESTDFIFAFRVQKLTVAKKTGVATRKDYFKGAMLGLREQGVLKGLPFVVTAVEATRPEELGMEEEIVEDEDGNTCVVPRCLG